MRKEQGNSVINVKEEKDLVTASGEYISAAAAYVLMLPSLLYAARSAHRLPLTLKASSLIQTCSSPLLRFLLCQKSSNGVPDGKWLLVDVVILKRSHQWGYAMRLLSTYRLTSVM